MDVVRPQLIWVEGRCYRVNASNKGFNRNDNTNLTQYIEDDSYEDDDIEEYVIEMKDNSFKAVFHAPQVFISQIVGFKSSTRKRIEAETKTQIQIPKIGVQGDIIIYGKSSKNVIAACRRINLIVLAGRNKQQFTHFLCVPFTNKNIQDAFAEFKFKVLENSSIRGIDESLFQNENKLHLTIGTLSLMDSVDRKTATEILNDCDKNIIKPISDKYGVINLHLCGLEYMNDDPSAIDVLYGQVHSEGMQLIADSVIEYFMSKGLMQRKYDKVKMHVTLMNSLFSENHENRKTFDGRLILQEFSNFDFGSQQLKEIHLSQRYSTAYNGFYEATTIIYL